MKRFSWFSLFGLLIVGLGYHSGYFLRAQVNSNAGHPPVTITVQSSSPANPGRVIFITESYREDGSLATSVTTAGSKAHPRVDVIDLSAKRHFVKDPLIEMFDEMVLTKQTYELRSRTPASCEAAVGPGISCEPAGASQILGYPVQRAVVTMQNRNSQTLELYLAPALGYLPLKRVSKRGEEVLSETVAVSITPGPPDSSVFALPAHYKRAESSSQFLMAGEVARGETSHLNAEAASKLDELQNTKRKLASTTRIE